MKTIISLILLLAAANQPVFCWSKHFLITEKALQDPVFDFTENTVAVESLEEFLRQEEKALRDFFHGYSAFLRDNPFYEYPKLNLSFREPTVKEFIRNLRINPSVTFPLILRDRLPVRDRDYIPSETFQGITLMRSESMFLRPSPRRAVIRDILATFSDEPDWGFDLELFDIPEYRFGEAPLGESRGTASKGIFHTLYRHEHFLVHWFHPEVAQSRLPERVLLFTGLSELAYRTGHPYWGTRFLAWALHYYQDLSQPYHSRMIPTLGAGFSMRYLLATGFSTRTRRQMERSKALTIANRHFLLEEYTADILTFSPEEVNLPPFAGAPEKKDPLSLLLFINDLSNDNIGFTNSMLKACFPPEVADNGYRNIYYDPGFDMHRIMKQISGPRKTNLIGVVNTNLRLAALATGSLLLLVMPPELRDVTVAGNR